MKMFYVKYRFLVWFYIGIILGTFCFNIFCQYFYKKIGIYSSYFIEINKMIQVNNLELFKYSLKQLGMESIFLIFASFTVFGGIAFDLFCFYKGMVIAFLVSTYVLKFGYGGLLIYLLSIFPHYVTYIILIYQLLSLGSYINSKIIVLKKGMYLGDSPGGIIKNFAVNFRRDRKVGLNILFICAMIIITAFLEVWVNIFLLRKIM